ncbi:SDR family NAD(P)-dependent oxidoreductase [Streptomyces sp. NPDC005356]|uniref:SDR family NAD(P)-dependent oxidoreductase n=1 Tax=Streptomyces sp. NPDC005356 TaxID=3157167 RepID=UPI0033B38AFF
MGRFDGKIALVTGAGSGIGRAIAARLARDGARVIVTDVTGQEDSVAKELGELATARRLDVADETSVAALEDWIAAEFGGLDILANNAGISGPNALTHEYPLDSFDKVVSVNIRGAYMVLQAALRLMLNSGGGAVVNSASIGGFRATPSASAYITSKGAMVMMTRVAALEYVQKGIRVNAIAPGTTHTAILDDASPELMAMLEGRIPQGRLGTPEEVANVAAFLADDREAGHVTGQIWTIDGGRSAG